MRARRIVMPGVSLLLAVAMAGSVRAQAENPGAIQGKWGLGAGLGNNSTEFTLIRGHSDRTAWLLNTQFFYLRQAQDEIVTSPGFPPVASGNNTQTLLAVGPGVRRFLAPSAVLSPYVDFTASYLYQRLVSSSRLTPTQIEGTLNGASAGIAIGAEYFTPWRFSAAIHSGVASYQWTQTRIEASDATGSGSSKSHTNRVISNLSPVLFARVYF